MLDQIDLDKKLSKKEFKEQFADIQNRMFKMQGDLLEAKIPMIIVFEGWDAAGKGTAIERLVNHLDPRGFKVHRIKEPSLEESRHPFLWRFWTKTPAKGKIAVFDRSWYGRILVEHAQGLVKKSKLDESFEEIRHFERQLADDHVAIVKFFLHISKKEQKKRLKALESDKFLSWKVEKADWERHRQYEKWELLVEETLTKTSTSFAPWTVVESTDAHWAHMKIFNTILESAAQALDRSRRRQAALKVSVEGETPSLTRHTPPTILSKLDLGVKLSEAQYKKEEAKYTALFRELEFKLYNHQIPMVIALEGWDAAGKGGNIKRLTRSLDPRGYEVAPIAAPTPEEKAHHFLWRFWNQIPKSGHITIYDRTWYGRVLVERVEGFCTEKEWRRAYQEIREFESHLANYGTAIVKFWIHISKDEQLKRFKERDEDPFKKYKITEEDWRNREKWDEYEEAVLDMLENTSTIHAPWTIVEGDDKLWARIKTLRTACEAVESRLAHHKGKGKGISKS